MSNNQQFLRNLNDLNKKVQLIQETLSLSGVNIKQDDTSLKQIEDKLSKRLIDEINKVRNENKVLKDELERIKKSFEPKLSNLEKEINVIKQAKPVVNSGSGLEAKLSNLEKEINVIKQAKPIVNGVSGLEAKVVNLEKEINVIKQAKPAINSDLEKLKNIENEFNKLKPNIPGPNQFVTLQNEFNKLKPNIPGPNQFVTLQKEFNQLKPNIPGPNQFVNLQKEFNQLKPNIIKIPELEKKLSNTSNDPTLRKDIDELKKNQKNVDEIDNVIKNNFSTTNVKFEEVNKAVLSLDDNLKEFNKIKADVEELKNKK